MNSALSGKLQELRRLMEARFNVHVDPRYDLDDGDVDRDRDDERHPSAWSEREKRQFLKDPEGPASYNLGDMHWSIDEDGDRWIVASWEKWSHRSVKSFPTYEEAWKYLRGELENYLYP